MSKVIEEVGWPRILKYFIFGFWDFIFQLLIYSPLRILWLKLGGATLGKNCFIDRVIFMNLDRTGLSGLKLGDDCYLGPAVLIDLAGKVTLENQTTIAAKSIILSHNSVGYRDHPLIKYYPKKTYHTVIGPGSAIGVGCIILPGVAIGARVLVGAGSVVTKSLPDGVMAVGSPAMVKKTFTT